MSNTDNQKNMVSRHYDMVVNLKKSGSDILFNTTGKTADMLHMVLGINGEAIETLNLLKDSSTTELDDDQFNDELELELGDILFYLHGFLVIHGKSFRVETIKSLCHEFEYKYIESVDFEAVKEEELAYNIVRNAGILLETIKKYWVYGKPFDKLETEISRILVFVKLLANKREWSINRVLESNISKLGARYKNFEYSDEQAIARSDENQRSNENKTKTVS